MCCSRCCALDVLYCVIGRPVDGSKEPASHDRQLHSHGNVCYGLLLDKHDIYPFTRGSRCPCGQCNMHRLPRCASTPTDWRRHDLKLMHFLIYADRIKTGLSQMTCAAAPLPMICTILPGAPWPHWTVAIMEAVKQAVMQTHHLIS